MSDDLVKASARIEALEAALRPFADAAEKADARAEQNERLGMGRLTDKATIGLGIKFGDVRRARDVLDGTPGKQTEENGQ